MDEYAITHYSGISGLGLVLAAYLWALGGRGHKFLRRMGATFAVCATVIFTSCLMQKFSWWILTIYPCLVLASSFGYGGDDLGDKVFRRSVFAAANLVAGVILAFIFGGWWILPMQVYCAVAIVFFALGNPLYAPAEEFLVAFLLYMWTVMYPFAVA